MLLANNNNCIELYNFESENMNGYDEDGTKCIELGNNWCTDIESDELSQSQIDELNTFYGLEGYSFESPNYHIYFKLEDFSDYDKVYYNKVKLDDSHKYLMQDVLSASSTYFETNYNEEYDFGLDIAWMCPVPNSEDEMYIFNEDPSDEKMNKVLNTIIEGKPMDIDCDFYTESYVYGLMDKTGKVIVEPSYDQLGTEYDGYIPACKDDKWGLIDLEGKVVIDFAYDDMGTYMDGVLPVANDDKWGAIDKKGKTIIPFEYDAMGDCNDGIICVKKDDKYGFINKKNKVIGDGFEYKNAYIFSECYAFAQTSDDKWVAVDKKGKVAHITSYDDVYPFDDGYAIVLKDKKFGLIDNDFNEVLPCKYDDVCCSDDSDLVTVAIDGKVGFYDKSGKEVIKPQYGSRMCVAFSDGLCPVCEYVEDSDDDTIPKWFVIDEKGNKVFDLDIQTRYFYGYGYDGFSEGVYGYEVDHNTLEDVDFSDDDDDDDAKDDKNEESDYIVYVDKTSKELFKITKDDSGNNLSAGQFDRDLAYVKVGDKAYYVDKKGNEVGPKYKIDD